MCTAQQKCHGTSLVTVAWASLLILLTAAGCLASATPTTRKSQSAISFPSICTSHQQDTDQVATLWQSIHDHPTAGAYNTLGVLYAAADRLACAIPAFELALRLDSTNWESHYNLALALLRKGDHSRAADELRSAIHEKPDSAAAHFALGTLLKNEQKWSLAKQEFNQTLKINPHQADASVALAEIAMKSGDHAAAISILQSALNSKPPAPQAELLEIARAGTYAEIGDREKALDILKTLVRDRPDSANAHFSLGELYARLDQQNTASDALSEYEQALRLDPGMEKARLASGTALISLKRYSEAVAALQQYVARLPKDDLGFFQLGLAYEGQNDLKEAARVLQHAAELNRKRPETLYALAHVLTEQGRSSDAISTLQAAAKLDPERAETHQQLALLLDKAARKELATAERARYETLKSREEKATNVRKLNQQANEFLQAGNPEAAVKAYRQALQLNPTDAKLRYNLSLALNKLGDQAAELAELLKAVQLDPNLSVAQNELGLIALNSGKHAEAEGRFRKAIAINSGYAEAKSNLAVLYSQKGKTDDAVKLFKQSIQDDPKYPKAHVNLGLIMAQRGAYAEAEQEFRSAIQTDPTNVEAFAALGMLAAKTDHGAEAVKIFRKAVALNPNSADAHLNLGIALVDQYDRPGGLQEFMEATRLNPKSAAAHYDLGRFYFETGKYAEAREQLQQASKLQPNFVNALYFLALTERQNNNLSVSTELFQKVVSLQPDNADAQYLLGQNLERSGKSAEAMEHWKAAVRADPNHSQALYNLGKALSKAHDPDAEQYQARFEKLQREQQVTDRVQQLGNFALEAANAQNWPQAMEQMSQAIELCGKCPQAAHLHRNLGLFYARTGNLEAAEKELRTVLELSPGDSDAEKALIALGNARSAQAR
jgi:tetratricopeptide (TPR) repeat protein